MSCNNFEIMAESTILTQYRTLLAECFTENVQIDNEEITKEESDVLQDLDPDEVYENFKDLIKSLLEFKRYVRKAEQNEQQEIENSNVSTISPEETQQFHNSLKQLSDTNEELKKNIQNLHAKIEALEKKLKETESVLENKDLIMNMSKGNSVESEKTNKKSLHHRICSDLVVDNSGTGERAVIKSVKFEYFPSGKKVPAKISPCKNKVSKGSNCCSPEKIKPNHSRSSSNMFIFDSKKFG